MAVTTTARMLFWRTGMLGRILKYITDLTVASETLQTRLLSSVTANSEGYFTYGRRNKVFDTNICSTNSDDSDTYHSDQFHLEGS